jgi:hypothetical protein
MLHAGISYVDGDNYSLWNVPAYLPLGFRALIISCVTINLIQLKASSELYVQSLLLHEID